VSKAKVLESERHESVLSVAAWNKKRLNAIRLRAACRRQYPECFNESEIADADFANLIGADRT